MTIRLRLTLLYSVILALTVLTFSILVYLWVERATVQRLSAVVELKAQRLSEAPRLELERFSTPSAGAIEPDLLQRRLADGTVVERTASLGARELPWSNAARNACLNQQPWTEIVLFDGREVISHCRPLLIEGRSEGVIQVGRSLADVAQSLGALKQILVAGSILVTLIAFGIGWWIAGLALRPMDWVTQTAQAIGSARDFGRRIQAAHPHDEIGRLTTTINTMLGELQAAYAQAEQALHAQRRFVADASHELRTPMTTIRGNIDLLRRDPPISNADRQEVLADMVDESERVIRLVQNLLSLARADAGRTLDRTPIALQPLLADLVRQFRLLAPQRSISYAAADDLLVLGDADALKQVFLILLDNALNYTAPPATISLLAQQGAGSVTIWVHDTGPGIAADQLGRLFERFFRADTARSGGGNGLGLAIAKALIEAQAGGISVSSQLGAGTSFCIVLPQANQADQSSTSNYA